MLTGIIGKKLGMTQVFDAKGRAEAATLIEAGPCVVTQIKTGTSDGYNAAQLGFGSNKKIKSPIKGQCRGLGEFRFLREIRMTSSEDVNIGDTIDAGMFNAGDKIDVVGTSKGRGFAGVVKRHGFRGGPKTHGQSDRLRAPGSVGGGTTPGRVWKGKKMAGHMGSQTVTVRNLEVLKADVENNLLVVKGAVPGMQKGLLIIKKANRSK